MILKANYLEKQDASQESSTNYVCSGDVLRTIGRDDGQSLSFITTSTNIYNNS